MTGVERRNVTARRTAARSFLTFMALIGPKKSLAGNISAYQVHDILLVLGGDAPNTFRGIKSHSTLPASGRVKPSLHTLCCGGLVLLGAEGNRLGIVQEKTLSYGKKKRCDRKVTPL